MISDSLKLTIKLQPVVICYSVASICSKLASKELPGDSTYNRPAGLECLINLRLMMIIVAMFAALFIYAIVWQRIIKNSKIAVVYANKSSYLFWTQIAAVVVFHESISLGNIIGIVIIFLGILLANCEMSYAE